MIFILRGVWAFDEVITKNAVRASTRLIALPNAEMLSMFVTLQAIDVEKIAPAVLIGSAPATILAAAEDHLETFVDVLAEVILIGLEDAEMECVARVDC